MKYVFKIVLLFTLCAVSFNLSAQKDYLGVASINFDNESYLLRWSAKTKTGRLLEEFLPAKANFASFETKLILECSSEGKEIADEVRVMMSTLALKKEENIVYSFQQIEAQAPDEIWIEYIQGNVQGGQPFTLEWNLNRYKLIGNRVVLFRTCHRGYNIEVNSFTKKANKKREEWIKEAMTFSFDTVKINNK